jgi:FkbM family methyltransferase
MRIQLGSDFSRMLFVGGDFEPNELTLLDRNLMEGMTFVDVGAHVGCYAIFASTKVGSTGRVIAIEPSRREADRLVTNIELNDQSNVTQVVAALSDTNGTASLHVAQDEHSGHNSLGTFLHEDVVEFRVESVATMTLDQLVQDHRLDRVDVVKLDVEGWERTVLNGARRSLIQYRPLVIFESFASDVDQYDDRVLEELALLGYETCWLDKETALPTRTAPLSGEATVIAEHPGRPWGMVFGEIRHEA